MHNAEPREICTVFNINDCDSQDYLAIVASYNISPPHFFESHYWQIFWIITK